MSIAPVSISSLNKSLNINFKGSQAANNPVFQDRADSFEYTSKHAEKNNAVKTALMAAVLAASMVMGQTQPQRAQAAALTAYEAENADNLASSLENAMAVKEESAGAEISKNKKNIPLMSETNKRVLSSEELKELAGLGILDKAQVIENLKTMKNSLIGDILPEMCKKAKISNIPNPAETKVTASCSDCGRDWGKCKYSDGKSKNQDVGTWDQSKNSKAYEKTPIDSLNHKIYLLKMPGVYSRADQRYTQDGVSAIKGGKEIIKYCKTPENQIKLGTIYNLQEALKSLGVKK